MESDLNEMCPLIGELNSYKSTIKDTVCPVDSLFYILFHSTCCSSLPGGICCGCGVIVIVLPVADSSLSIFAESVLEIRVMRLSQNEPSIG